MDDKRSVSVDLASIFMDIGRGKAPNSVGSSIAKARSRQGGKVEQTVVPSVEPRVNRRFSFAGRWVELHRIRLNAHQGGEVSRQLDMGNLGEHGISQILDHEGHTVRLRPSGREKGSRLSFTGLESDSSPAQFTTQFYQAPVVSTFV